MEEEPVSWSSTKDGKPKRCYPSRHCGFGRTLFLYSYDIFTREVIVVLGEILEAKEGARCVEKILSHLGPCQSFRQTMVENLVRSVAE